MKCIYVAIGQKASTVASIVNTLEEFGAMAYTTERAEKEALKLYKKELQCDHQHAIEAYCRDWELSGITKSLPFAQKVNQTGHVLNLKPKRKFDEYM